MTSKVIGLDLSLRSTGVAWTTPVSSGTECIKTGKVHWIAAVVQICERVEEIAQGSDLAVIESELALRYRVRGSVQLGKVHGAVALILARLQIPIIYVAPAQLRAFAQLPKGMKAKDYLFPGDKRSDDEIDALILMLIGKAYLGEVRLDREKQAIVRRLTICQI